MEVIEYESPHGAAKQPDSGWRVCFRSVADERYEPVREVPVKMLAFSVWRQHPDVKRVREPSERLIHLA